MLKKLLFFVVLTLLVIPLLPSSLTASPPQDTFTTFLPMVIDRQGPPPPNGFGAEILNHGFAAAPSAELAEAAGLSWARVNRLRWSDVEAEQGTYRWDRIAPLEAALATYATHNLNPVLIIGEVPTWARQNPESTCGPIREDALDDFATFVAAVAERYSGAPYYLRYIEIFNEPDVSQEQIERDAPYGCWGDIQDEDSFGGRYYGTMLSVVYPRVKAVAPDIQVITGGLLLDCDYTYDYSPSRNCTSSRFLRGVLQASSRQNFDIIGVHGYGIHTVARRDWDRAYSTWEHRGGVTAGKLSFIHAELRAAGMSAPVLFTESGMICYTGASCNADQTLLHDDQATYMVRLHARVRANGGLGALWYALEDPGWRYTGLLGNNLTPRPAYYAARFLSQWMGEATFEGRLGSGTDELEGYAFRTPEARWEVYWSNTATPYPLTVPPNAHLYNKTGDPLVFPVGGSTFVGFEPLIVKIPME